MNLVTAQEMQLMDRETINTYGIPGRVLMENAGRGAAKMLMENIPDIFQKRVAVFTGRGNNGGDGFVIARYLFENGIKTAVFTLSSRDRIGGDAKANLNLLLPLDIDVIEIPDAHSFSHHTAALLHYDIFVDAVLGTGLSSDVRGHFKDIIAWINKQNKYVFAVDIPSGLNADTGQACGISIEANATATFGCAKIGHVVYPGRTYTGTLKTIDIGIPAHIRKAVNPQHHLLTTNMIGKYFTPRDPEAHKGSTGHLFIIGGSAGKSGAVTLAGLAALRSGAGLVTLGVPHSLNSVMETTTLEAMTAALPDSASAGIDETSVDKILDLLNGKSCLAIGPGLGLSDSTRKLVRHIVARTPLPTVMDADALNCLAADTSVLKSAQAPIILTPHPGEMARLTGSSSKAVQNDRITVARSFTQKFGCFVILKGAATIISDPDGNIYINPTGNPGMAAGGMGDVLTGIIGGFITQGFPLKAAIQAAVFLHGAAADHLLQTIGPVGYSASDVANGLPRQIARMIQMHGGPTAATGL